MPSISSPPRPPTNAPAAARAAVAPALAMPARSGAHRVVATGHAHIDTAWLWPLAETVRKCSRTFASAVAMMDAEPGFRFSCSQAQQYAWIAEQEPELFARIVDKVEDGQWIPVGGMWVEPDMNLPSGESIVRQIVHGQRWFEQHLGRRCSEVWIPDVFGYPAGLPQVFAAGGMRRFVTQKLSWNRTNRFPHSTFWWEGIDGTRVLTHFPPVDTYNAEITPAELAYSVGRFAEHEWSSWSLMPFGYGDGGGGPTREMLERLRRVADLDGMPRVEQGAPEEFFDRVDAEIAGGAPVPVWRGELYFETHRGTLTSQLRTKVGNRRCERLLREAELWSAAAGQASDLDTLWQEVLTLQFHDIIPGSSIAWVHAEAEAAYDRIAAELEQRIAASVAALAPPGQVLANPATYERDEVVVVAGQAPPGDVQHLADGRVAFRARVPGLGMAPAESLEPTDRVVVTDRSMKNGHVAMSWDLDGNLRSVIDVARARELLPAGELGAVLELAADQPVRYDAWDLESWVRSDPQRLTTRQRRGDRVGPIGRDGARATILRAVFRGADIRAACRVAADRCRGGARLAPRGAPAVAGVPARRAHRGGDLRRAVRRGQAPDARLDVVGRRQVRGLRPPLRRRLRALVRRRRAQRWSLRARRVRRRRARQPRPRRSLPGPRPGQGSPRRDDQPDAAWPGTGRCRRRGGAARSPGARRHRRHRVDAFRRPS